ncbi:hypothetical protein [Achromobacter deleyi]|uniref:hypothetical protein n=1 Tax=Achromobacter deleyi TaxID=1353891 RepID=UPI001F1F2CE4|nr:hypothetical protein [Achromobacter deleyi]UIP22628.1 hypothetical protein LYZ39_08960 [Achromobacter deleyi]
MLIVTSIRKMAGACAFGVFVTLAGTGQTVFAQAQADASAPAPLATGLTESGSAEGQVIEAVRSGDILSIKVRFKPLVPSKTEMLYSGISKDDYENSFYVIAGNKKHLLLKDSNDKPLTNPKVLIRTSKDAPIAGAWQGKFPAPPKEVSEVSLTIPGVETFDAIKITDR